MTERRFDIDFVYARLRQAGLGLFAGSAATGLNFDDAALEVLGAGDAPAGDAGAWLRARVHPADQRVIDALLEATAATTVRFRVRAADDPYRWVEATVTLEETGLVGAIRRVEGARVCSRPVDAGAGATDAVRSEERPGRGGVSDASPPLELAATQRALERAVAEVERFAFVISHDLKAPLRGLRLAVGWLRDELGTGLSDSARENMAFIETRSQRLTNLVNGVLEYSRLGRGSPPQVPVDPHAVALEAIEDIAGGATLAIRLSGPFPRVLCDPTQLKQVFQNLIDNAIKYANAPELRLKISANATDDLVQIAVEDNGVGIPPEHRTRVFQPFVRLEPDDDGDSTGMGLSFCRRIVESWGGRIDVEDATDGGTKVVFSVKRAT